MMLVVSSKMMLFLSTKSLQAGSNTVKAMACRFLQASSSSFILAQVPKMMIYHGFNIICVIFPSGNSGDFQLVTALLVFWMVSRRAWKNPSVRP